MNNKGEFSKIGSLLAIFIGVVACLALYGSIADSIGDTTLTVGVVNQSFTFPQSGGNITLTGQALVGTPLIINSTVANATYNSVPANNFTVNNYQIINGNLAVTITSLTNTFNNTAVNITYTYEPLGYAKEAGTRNMIGLIAVFTVLALLASVIWAAWKDGGIEAFSR